MWESLCPIVSYRCEKCERFTAHDLGLTREHSSCVFSRNPIVPRLSRTSCNRSVNIVVPIILENDAILQPGWVIRYVPRGDAFALLCRASSEQTLFSGIAIYLVAFHSRTLTRSLASDTGIFALRENALAPSIHAAQLRSRFKICASRYFLGKSFF